MVDSYVAGSLNESLNRALAFLQAGNLSSAEALLESMMSRWPDQVDVLHLCGLCACERKDYPRAVRLLSQACQKESGIPELHFNLGNALVGLGDREQAIQSFREATRIRPEFQPAAWRLAELLRDQGSFLEAAQCFRKIAEREGHDHNAWRSEGEAYLMAGDADRAITAFGRSITIFPDDCRVWNNLGVAFSQNGQLQRGMDAFRRSAELDPDYVGALGNYANALRDGGRVEEAMRCFERAIERAPDNLIIRSNALFTSLCSDRISVSQCFSAHEKYDQIVSVKRHLVPEVNPERSARHQVIRVAYLSADFCEHPVAYFMDGVLDHHDPSRVDIFLYSNGHKNDEWTRRLQSRKVHWRSISGLSDEALKAVSQMDEIDILVDLSGHTAYNRLPAISSRLAPIQMHYLGYPFSTGLSSMDYRITDSMVDPENDNASESLIRLSRSYYAYSPPFNVPEISPLPMLSNSAPTFGVCSNLAKVSPLTLDRWAGVLCAIPGSRLHWRAKAFADSETLQKMQAALSDRGVNADRIVLSSWAESSRRWEFFEKIDLAFDTFPYNQATNTCEALWMGVPTLTVAGASHQARMGASILNAAELAEFIAPNADDWIGNALKVIGNPDRLAELRQTMRTRLKSSALLDVAGLTRQLEEIYISLR